MNVPKFIKSCSVKILLENCLVSCSNCRYQQILLPIIDVKRHSFEFKKKKRASQRNRQRQMGYFWENFCYSVRYSELHENFHFWIPYLWKEQRGDYLGKVMNNMSCLYTKWNSYDPGPFHVKSFYIVRFWKQLKNIEVCKSYFVWKRSSFAMFQWVSL